MIAKAALLFLFGTTLTSGQFWPGMNLAPYGIALASTTKSGGCPSGPELAPLICKFMQHNIGLQFKPQLIEPSTYIAPLVVEKCDTPKLEMEIELPSQVEEKKPLFIPEAPELPPITIPKFPVPVIIEEPPAHIAEHYHSTGIAIMPIANIPAAPELPHQEIEELPQETLHLSPLPAAPELPAFVMPELPVRIVEEWPKPAAPFVEEKPAEGPIPVYNEPLAPLPVAPELPTFVMPKFPVHIIKQELDIPAAPCLEDKPALAPISAYFEPLPAAPEFPAFVMPEFPVRLIEQTLPIPAAPSMEDEPVRAPIAVYAEPLAPLPAAPELPAFVMPQIPIHVAAPESPMATTPIYNNEPAPEPMPAYVEPLAPLPAAPELPAFVMPEIPTQISEEKLAVSAEPFLNNAAIPAPMPTYAAPLPAAPELPQFEIPSFAVRVAEYPLAAGHFLPIPTYGQPMHELNYNMIDYQPMPVPQSPELPVFSMPELPVQKVEHDSHMFGAPFIYEEPRPAVFQPLVPIPAAPELPKFSLPEFPTRVEIPAAPVTIEQPQWEPNLDEKHIAEVEYNTIEYQPMVVPQPPELPEFVMPELPIRVAEIPKTAAPDLESSALIVVVPEDIEPLSPVPAAPELPPASIYEIPVRMEFPSAESEDKAAPEPIEIPQAPKWTELGMPEFPVKIEIEDHAPCAPRFLMPSPFYQKLFPSDLALYNEKAKEMQNIVLPNQPIDSSAFRMPCVYNLVMQHVLPNIMPHSFRPMENLGTQPVPFVHCS